MHLFMKLPILSIITNQYTQFLSYLSLYLSDDVQSWELEDYLSVLMDREFNTSVEDTSIPTVHRSLLLFTLYMQYIIDIKEDM